MSVKEKTHGSGQFPKGVSGNPAGRPRGSRNRATLLIESLLEDEAETLTRKAIELAKGGDLTALRLCLERILPVRKDRPIQLSLPPTETVKQIAAAMGAVCRAIAEGQVTPSEGEALCNVLVAQQAVRVNADLESRMQEIEYRLSLGRVFSDSGKLITPERDFGFGREQSLFESNSQMQQIKNKKSDRKPEEPVEKESK